MAKRVAVVGSRGYPDLGLVREFVRRLADRDPSATVVSSGDDGACKAALSEAGLVGLRTETVRLDHAAHGNAARRVRGDEIVSLCAVVAAFWDGSSVGTRRIIERAEAAGLQVSVRGAEGEKHNRAPAAKGARVFGIAKVEAYVASMGGVVLSRSRARGKGRGKWTFRCTNGHEWSRRATAVGEGKPWCRQCATDEAVKPLEAHVASMGGEIIGRSIRVSDKWGFRCANGHEWYRSPLYEMGSLRWCHHCKVDAEAEALIAEHDDDGPPCVDCWKRPAATGKEVCRLCRSRQRRRKSLPRRDCADGCGRLALAGWTRCSKCLRARRDASGRAFASQEKFRRHISESIRRTVEAAERYGLCACGKKAYVGGNGVRLVDPDLGYGARGVLKRGEADGWPDRLVPGCPGCFPKCSRCGERFAKRESADKMCPKCFPDVERESREGAALRAAKALAVSEAREKREREGEEAKILNRTNRRNGVCVACGRLTRHRNRGRCDLCQEVDREKLILKVRTMKAYGGKCSSCGCSVLAFLRIDHIDDVRPLGAPRTGFELWQWLEERGWPTDNFRCLCSNCNQAYEYYGYLPTDGRPADWDHEALLARIDPARIAANVMGLCRQLDDMRLAFCDGKHYREFALATGLPERVPLIAKRTVAGWFPPTDAGRWAVAPRTTMFGAALAKEIGIVLGLDGRLCATCGEEMAPEYFGPAPGYEGRLNHLRVRGAAGRHMDGHCYLCRRAKRLKCRLAVIQKYGGACQCCGETTYEFLAMDHVGGRRPKGFATHGDALYKQLLAAPRKGDYRVLCHQCNWAYYVYGQRCPHQWGASGMTLVAQSLVSSAMVPEILASKSLMRDVLEEAGRGASLAVGMWRARNKRDRDTEVVDVDTSAYDTSVVATVPVGPHKAVVDLHRLPEVMQHRWRLNKQNGRVYVIARLPRENGRQRSLYLHRLIAKPAPGEWVRHIDGNGLNNLSDNLRVTRSSSSLEAK